MAIYQRPRRVEIESELAMNASGPVQKFVWRDRVISSANA